jgi:bacterioferritin
MLDRLEPEEADSLPQAEADLPREFLDTLQREVADKYTEMLEHIRHSWVLPGGALGWGLMDQAMEKMRHLAHFAEDVAENGVEPDLSLAEYSRSSDPGTALRASLQRLQEARERHKGVRAMEETGKHAGLVLNLDLTLRSSFRRRRSGIGSRECDPLPYTGGIFTASRGMSRGALPENVFG